MSGKRKYAIAAAAGAILLLGCLAAVLLAWGNKNIITINGIPVEKDEIIMYIQDERADICSWFYRNYQADCNAEDFWEKEYEGTTPAGKLSEAVIQKLKEAKTAQQQMKEEGFVETVSFQELEKLMDAENQKRRQAEEEGQVIYGNSQFSMEQYYNWYYSQGKTRLKEQFHQTFTDYTEEDLENWYRQQEPYTGAVSGEVKFYVCDSSISEEVAQQLFADVTASLDKGMSDGEIEAMADENYHTGLVIQERPVREEEVGKEDAAYASVMEAFKSLEEKQFSEILPLGQSYGIFQVMKKEGGEDMPFQSVKESVVYQYIEEAFEENLRALAEGAEITVDEKAFTKLIKEIVR